MKYRRNIISKKRHGNASFSISIVNDEKKKKKKRKKLERIKQDSVSDKCSGLQDYQPKNFQEIRQYSEMTEKLERGRPQKLITVFRVEVH